VTKITSRKFDEKAFICLDKKRIIEVKVSLKSKKFCLHLAAFLLLSTILSLSSFLVNGATVIDNTWSTGQSIPQTGFGLRAAAVNDKIYVIGRTLNYEYNPVNDSWLAKTPMPTNRSSFSIASYQGQIYAIGGWSDYALTNNEVYEPSSDTWKTLTPIPIAESHLDANVVNGKIYVIGLTDNQNCVNLQYDIAGDKWTSKNLMPYPVKAYASAVCDGKIFIFGGLGSDMNQTQIYNPAIDSWTLGTPIPTSVANAVGISTSGVLAPKRIYVLGGSIGVDGTNLNQIYDPEDNSWGVGASLPTARTGLTAAVVNDYIYTFGGSSSVVFSPAFDIAEKYIPYGYELTTTPSVSEFSWFTILPILLTIPIAIAFVRKRRQRNERSVE
jgi:hypothetical protein